MPEKGRASRVLMVLYHFPPIGGISMSRNARIVQRLPAHGWDPVVVTPTAAVSEPRDPSSTGLVSADADVQRTGYFELHQLKPLVDPVRALLATAVRLPRPGSVPGAAPPPPSDVQGDVDATTQATRRIAWVRRRLMFPDNQAGWLPFAFVRAFRLARGGSSDLIFSSSPPVTAHLAAGLVARITRTGWVAEFRDPWLGNALELPHPWIERRLRTKVERWITHAADRVICVTPRLSLMYQRRYPDVVIETITNGYERSELAAPATDRSAGGPYTLVYTGTLDRPDELDTFLAGVALVVGRRPELRDTLAIVFYGTVSARCRAIADRYSSDSLPGIIRFGGFVPRAEALAALGRADAALVLLGSGPGMDLFMPGKLYDYIGGDHQVFAMLPPGDAHEMLTNLDWGVVADPDPVSVGSGLERLIGFPRPARRADPEGVYDRANLVAALARTFESVVAKRRHDTGPRP